MLPSTPAFVKNAMTMKPGVDASPKPLAPRTATRSTKKGLAPLGAQATQAGPADPRPDYTEIDAQPLNRVVQQLFRNKMVDAIGRDSPMEGYDAIIDLTRTLNTQYATTRETQVATVGILASLFPSWLPGAFAVMFAAPLPGLSCRLNAWATWLTCQWLMGECEINDVPIDGGGVGEGYGVLVKRCRYLEESGCASICINSCKVPTQEFFAKNMGLPLMMEPNYEDFSCQFSFGRTPPPQGEDPAFSTPCFQQCPTKSAQPAASNGDDVGQCHKVEVQDV